MPTRTAEKTKLGLVATIAIIVIGVTAFYDATDETRRPFFACFVTGLICGFLTIFLDTVVKGKGPRKFGCTAKYFGFFVLSAAAGFLFTWSRGALAKITGHADFLSPEKISNWQIWTRFFIGLGASLLLFEAARIKLVKWGIIRTDKPEEESMKDEG
ncbi:MAG: hypothetical protein E3J72_07325 [Planctomycetota bacterium]|nr:MAG: hypothetical protein E3J72_07325 [Planctomycetota bacterium]